MLPVQKPIGLPTAFDASTPLSSFFQHRRKEKDAACPPYQAGFLLQYTLLIYILILINIKIVNFIYFYIFSSELNISLS